MTYLCEVLFTVFAGEMYQWITHNFKSECWMERLEGWMERLVDLMGINSQTMIIYKENSEIIHPTILKFRRSLGPCSCQQHYDAHEYMMWHLGNGCSSSFNFNIYKESLEKEWGHTFNSQGRKQSHALLDKCTASLRQKSYPNFIKWLACFFTCRNLINMGEL